MLEEKLRELAQSNRYPFHMPGHKRMLDGTNPYAIDITEIEDFDNLHHAEGIIKDAEDAAAKIYGAQKAYYLVNGSTCGILAAISASVKRGGKILVARNCHKSVYHAIFLRQLSPEYVYPENTHYGIQGQISVNAIEKKLAECPDIQAVVLTSPTYDGLVSDVKSISEVVHRRNIPLIVDEAHGAHFGFHEAFPQNAVAYVDAVIMSVHKTLPAFTQTAVLCLCSDRIDEKEVEKYLGIYETSSPSYVLMAGIERSLRMVSDGGSELFVAYVEKLSGFRASVRNLKHLEVPDAGDFSREEAYAFDPGKILIVTKNGMSGRQLQEMLLRDYALQMEMASGNYVVAMTSFMDSEEGFRRLSHALHAIDARMEDTGKVAFSPKDIYRQPEKQMEPYQAEEAAHGCIRLEDAAGQVSADYIYLYPPGIPMIVPGEIVTEPMIQIVRQCQVAGLDVEGLPETDTINIVKNARIDYN